MDVLARLNRNTLQDTEVLMAMAETLLEQLNGDGVALAAGSLEPLPCWSNQGVGRLHGPDQDGFEPEE